MKSTCEDCGVELGYSSMYGPTLCPNCLAHGGDLDLDDMEESEAREQELLDDDYYGEGFIGVYEPELAKRLQRVAGELGHNFRIEPDRQGREHVVAIVYTGTAHIGIPRDLSHFWSVWEEKEATRRHQLSKRAKKRERVNSIKKAKREGTLEVSRLPERT